MDDSTKIKALSIYFNHWGVEEARLRRRQEGLKATMDKIRLVFLHEDDNPALLLDEVASYFDEYYYFDRDHVVLHNLIESLLGSSTFIRKRDYLQKMSKVFYIDLYMFYKMNWSYKNVHNADAIVALF